MADVTRPSTAAIECLVAATSSANEIVGVLYNADVVSVFFEDVVHTLPAGSVHKPPWTRTTGEAPVLCIAVTGISLADFGVTCRGDVLDRRTYKANVVIRGGCSRPSIGATDLSDPTAGAEYPMFQPGFAGHSYMTVRIGVEARAVATDHRSENR